MLNILALATLGVLSPMQATAAPAKPALAVLDFQPSNASAGDAVFVSEFIRAAAVRANVYSVVDKKNIEKILTEQAFQKTGCTEAECAVKLGKILNVKKVLVGIYGVLESTKIIIAKMVDVETGQIERSETVQGFSPADADKVTDELVRKLFGLTVAAPVTPVKPALNFADIWEIWALWSADRLWPAGYPNRAISIKADTLGPTVAFRNWTTSYWGWEIGAGLPWKGGRASENYNLMISLLSQRYLSDSLYFYIGLGGGRFSRTLGTTNTGLFGSRSVGVWSEGWSKSSDSESWYWDPHADYYMYSVGEYYPSHFVKADPLRGPLYRIFFGWEWWLDAKKLNAVSLDLGIQNGEAASKVTYYNDYYGRYHEVTITQSAPEFFASLSYSIYFYTRNAGATAPAK